jgi:transcriptional regulator with XRE-family HTH domain
MIHERIREARQQRGWTQAQLAERSGITIGYIKQLEGGHKPNPTQDTLHKLARAFGISVSELLGEDDELARPVPPVPTWRAAGVSEDQIARAAAVWADMPRDWRAKVSGHLLTSARSLATVDALIEQVQVRLDALKAQADEGHGSPPAGDSVGPEDALDIEADDQATRHSHLLFSPGR